MLKYLPALVLLSLPVAFAQSDYMTVNTDAGLYRFGDLVVVYGTVTPLPNQQITLKVQTESSVVQIDQFPVSQDGTYTYIVNTNGDQWSESGQYTILLRYGESSQALTFDFVASGVTDDDLLLFEVPDGGGTFDVEYAIWGGAVQNIVVDQENLALRISIDAEENGDLVLDLPREYIDASHDGVDVDYIVLVDNLPVPHIDDGGSEVRRLTVQFPQGASEIMIIGTMVVPEFGTVLLIMTVATIATLAVRYGWRTTLTA